MGEHLLLTPSCHCLPPPSRTLNTGLALAFGRARRTAVRPVGLDRSALHWRVGPRNAETDAILWAGGANYSLHVPHGTRVVAGVAFETVGPPPFLPISRAHIDPGGSALPYENSACTTARSTTDTSASVPAMETPLSSRAPPVRRAPRVHLACKPAQLLDDLSLLVTRHLAFHWSTEELGPRRFLEPRLLRDRLAETNDVLTLVQPRRVLSPPTRKPDPTAIGSRIRLMADMVP